VDKFEKVLINQQLRWQSGVPNVQLLRGTVQLLRGTVQLLRGTVQLLRGTVQLLRAELE
jgi:hypothetical protein